jgi:hypothetical protein
VVKKAENQKATPVAEEQKSVFAAPEDRIFVRVLYNEVLYQARCESSWTIADLI